MTNVYEKRNMVNFQDLLGCSLTVLESLAEEKGIEVETRMVEAPLFVEEDPQKLVRIFNDLFLKALKYNRTGGKITLEISFENENKVRISAWLNCTVGWSVVC